MEPDTDEPQIPLAYEAPGDIPRRSVGKSVAVGSLIGAVVFGLVMGIEYLGWIRNEMLGASLFPLVIIFVAVVEWLKLPESGAAALTVAIAQYVLYGAALGAARAKRRIAFYLLLLTLIHVVIAAISLFLLESVFD